MPLAPQTLDFRTIDGTVLRADYFPVEGEKNGIVVMAQGIALLKDHYLFNWAQRFQAAGYAALTYDHRGWGGSEGTPRNVVHPLQQAEDYHDAITFARSLPGIDPSRVVIWGIGHSGGASMIAAGDNPFVKAAILVMPFNSGKLDLGVFTPELVGKAWAAREATIKPDAVTVDQPAYEQVYDATEEQAQGDRNGVIYHGPHPFKFVQGGAEIALKRGLAYERVLSLDSFYHISKVEPRQHVYKIAPKPLLYLAATEDPLSGPLEEQKKTFALAGEPKEFVVLDGSHLDHYFGDKFEHNIAVQVDFLKRYV